MKHLIHVAVSTANPLAPIPAAAEARGFAGHDDGGFHGGGSVMASGVTCVPAARGGEARRLQRPITHLLSARLRVRRLGLGLGLAADDFGYGYDSEDYFGSYAHVAYGYVPPRTAPELYRLQR